MLPLSGKMPFGGRKPYCDWDMRTHIPVAIRFADMISYFRWPCHDTTMSFSEHRARRPEAAQRHPKEARGGPKGFHRHLKTPQREPKGATEGQNYIYKPPINRPSGRYVMYMIYIYIYTTI